MKTKKKEQSPSRFTRGEKVGSKRGHHGRKMEKKEDMGTYGQTPKADMDIPIA